MWSLSIDFSDISPHTSQTGPTCEKISDALSSYSQLVQTPHNLRNHWLVVASPLRGEFSRRGRLNGTGLLCSSSQLVYVKLFAFSRHQ